MITGLRSPTARVVFRDDAKSPLLIACARQVITEEQELVQSIDALRGGDRLIADVLVARGFDVKVRARITYVDGYEDTNNEDNGPPRLPANDVYTIARLEKPITKKELAKIDTDCCTFSERADYDGEEIPHGTFFPFILDAIGREQWVIRRGAAGR